jgi:UDP-N-acetylmuramyl pentapeptide synthase
VGAEREGFEPDRIYLCEDVAQVVERLPGIIRRGDLLLVKASRVARLERVVDALRATADRTIVAKGGAT